jgi:hypothetical protein
MIFGLEALRENDRLPLAEASGKLNSLPHSFETHILV